MIVKLPNIDQDEENSQWLKTEYPDERIEKQERSLDDILKEIDTIIDSGKVGKSFKVSVEKSLPGFNATITKSDKDISIFLNEVQIEKSDSAENIINVLESIPFDFKFGCTIIVSPVDDTVSSVCLNDIFTDKLEKAQYGDRKKKLKSFFNKYLSKSKYFSVRDSEVVLSEENLPVAIEKMVKLPDPEGAIIKSMDSLYGDSDSTYLVNNSLRFNAIVLDKSEEDGKTIYTCGVLA